MLLDNASDRRQCGVILNDKHWCFVFFLLNFLDCFLPGYFSILFNGSIHNTSFVTSVQQKFFHLLKSKVPASGVEQMRPILRAKENGMMVVTWAGWHDEVKRYWFLSVGFMYRSTTTLPYCTDREVSRNAKELVLSRCMALCWWSSL